MLPGQATPDALEMPRSLGLNPAHEQVRVAVGVALLGAVPLLAVVLVTRRAVGALAQPISPLGLILCGLLLAAWAVVVRRWMPGCSRNASTMQRAQDWFPPIVLLLACLAILLPGSSLWGATGLVALLAAEEAATWGLGPRVRRAPSKPFGSTRTKTNSALEPPTADELSENVSAELIRRREPDGKETLSGRLRAQFATGQRIVSVHVAFCPPFARPPQCEAEQVDGPAATVRVAQVLAYGTRFEVKLDAPAARASSVLIEFAVFEAASR